MHILAQNTSGYARVRARIHVNFCGTPNSLSAAEALPPRCPTSTSTMAATAANARPTRPHAQQQQPRAHPPALTATTHARGPRARCADAHLSTKRKRRPEGAYVHPRQRPWNPTHPQQQQRRCPAATPTGVSTTAAAAPSPPPPVQEALERGPPMHTSAQNANADPRVHVRHPRQHPWNPTHPHQQHCCYLTATPTSTSTTVAAATARAPTRPHPHPHRLCKRPSSEVCRHPSRPKTQASTGGCVRASTSTSVGPQTHCQQQQQQQPLRTRPHSHPHACAASTRTKHAGHSSYCKVHTL